MKPVQLILLLAGLMAVVFMITFFGMYVGPGPKPIVTKRSGSGGEGDYAASPLEFARTRFPSEKNDAEVPLQTEFGQPGWYDFWFHNPSDKEVRLGLNGKNCVCTEVQLYLLKSETVAQLLPLPLAGLSANAPLDAVVAAVVADKRAADLVEKSADMAAKLDPNDDTSSGIVAPKQIGFLRVKWDGRRADGGPFKKQTLNATLWYSSKSSGVTSDLQVLGAWLVEPVLFDQREIEVGSLTPDDGVRTMYCRCWSSTRRNMQVVCDTNNDPFVSCELRPFGRTDDVQIRKFLPEMPDIREGHVIAVKVRPRSADGSKALDLGPFRRRFTVRILVDGEEIAKEIILVQGKIKGDVRVIAPNQDSSEILLLGSFPVKSGKTVTASVEVERANVTVAIEKTPKYIKATLEPQTESGKTGWLLRVQILPNSISGVLPRDESEIWLSVKSPGEPARRVRIPVLGEATQ